jgi:mannose/fructose-specific phosphotransferase system component IIA
MNDDGLRGVVVGHGDMAQGLVDAVRAIAGIDEQALVAVSNRGLAPDALIERVRDATAGRPSVVFTDLPSGSCGSAARILTRNATGIVVVCGVNLPMLLDFVTHRDMAREELLERLVSRARASIQSVFPPPGHGDPAVQS